MNTFAQVYIYVCFMCTFTAGSFGPLLWMILLSQQVNTPLFLKDPWCLDLSFVGLWKKNLEWEKRVRSGGRALMVGQCGWRGSVLTSPLLHPVLKVGCKQACAETSQIAPPRLAHPFGSSTFSCFGKQPLFFILYHSHSRTKNFAASPSYTPTHLPTNFCLLNEWMNGLSSACSQH